MFKKLKETLSKTKEKTETAIAETTTNVNQAVNKANELMNVSSENIEFIAGTICIGILISVAKNISTIAVNSKKIKVLNSANDILKDLRYHR